jgi:hypothetical protein
MREHDRIDPLDPVETVLEMFDDEESRRLLTSAMPPAA